MQSLKKDLKGICHNLRDIQQDAPVTDKRPLNIKPKSHLPQTCKNVKHPDYLNNIKSIKNSMQSLQKMNNDLLNNVNQLEKDYNDSIDDILEENNEPNMPIAEKTHDTKNTCFCQPCTITQPGSYILCDHVNGPITINANNVALSLNGYTVVPKAGNPYGIKINGSQVCVYDGFILGNPQTPVGIDIANARNVKIENIQVSDFPSTGIALSAAQGCVIQFCTIDSLTKTGSGINIVNTTGCVIQHCIMLGKKIGLVLENTADSTFEHLNITNCLQSGIELHNSVYNVFCRCDTSNILNNTEPWFAYGIALFNSEHNTFQECIVNNVTANSINPPENYSAAGIFLFESNNNKIVDCKIELIKGENNLSAYGIFINLIPPSAPSLNNIIKNNIINNVISANVSCGIQTNGSNTIIEKNTITNVTGTDNSGPGNGASGIYCNINSSNNAINKNIITDIVNISGGVPTKAYGIFVDDNSDYNIITKNRVTKSYYGFKTGTATHNSILGNNTNNNTTPYDGVGIFSQDASAALSPNYMVNYFHS